MWKKCASQSGCVEWGFSQLCQLLNIECFTCFVHIIKSRCNTYVFGATAPYHIPFQIKVMVNGIMS